MARSADEAHWRDLESHAHLPEVQERIRQEIQEGDDSCPCPTLMAEFASCRFDSVSLPRTPPMTEPLRDGTA